MSRLMSCRAAKGPLRVSKRCPTYSMRTNFSMTSGLAVITTLGQRQKTTIQKQADNTDDKHGHQNVLDVQFVPFIQPPEPKAGAAVQPFDCTQNQPSSTNRQDSSVTPVGKH